MSSEISIEIQAQARDLTNSLAWKEAQKKLKDTYYARMVAEPVGSLTAAATHARMQVLEDFVQEMAILVVEARRERASR